MKTARKEFDKNTGENYKADSGAVVVMETKTGRIVAMASQPDVRPQRLGRRHLRQGLRQAHRQELQLPAAQPGDPGPGRPRLDLQGDLVDRRGQRRLRLRRRLPLPQLVHRRRPGLQELRVQGLRQHHPRPGPGGLLRHRLLRPRPPASGRRTAAPSPRSTPTTGSTRPPTSSASARRPASTSPTRSPAASPTASGSRTSGRPTRTPGASRARRTAPTSSRSPTRTASKATGCAPVTPSTTPSARATPSSPRSRWPPIYAAIANGGTLYDPTIGKAVISADGKTRPGDQAQVARQAADGRQDPRPDRQGPRGSRDPRHPPPGGSAAGRRTRSRCTPRRVPPRSTASRRPPGSPRTPRTTRSS